MVFDDIPEDAEMSYPCPHSPHCGGDVMFNFESKRWECSKCDFSAAAEHKG